MPNGSSGALGSYHQTYDGQLSSGKGARRRWADGVRLLYLRIEHEICGSTNQRAHAPKH